VSEHRPTDLEIMQYVDGELETERAEQVERFLRQSDEGRALVATLREIGSQLREHALAEAQARGADAVADGVMHRLERRDGRGAGGVWLYVAAAMAAAAALLFVAWQLVGSSTPSSLTGPIVPSFSLSSSPGLVVASAPVPGEEDDMEPGVSVDAIDFGSTTGTIFYVPSDTGTTTTVVWLSDPEVGGTE
jgi:anti-sigma factor RsiW